jgi:hypothetical protein
MRKRRRVRGVLAAAALLVVAVPSAAAATDHLGPVDALDGGSQTGAACSMDPRDPSLMKPGVRLCNDQVISDPFATGQERAYTQQPVPAGETARIDQVPAPSDSPEFGIGWWMVGIAVAASGAAGLIVGLRRGRPHALSS